MKKKIFITTLLILFLVALILRHWISYVIHLADHQFRSIYTRQIISDNLIESQADSTIRERLQKIGEIKEFGKKLYGLQKSHSFDYYVILPRKTLGWNLTIARPLELKAREFRFPLIGKFGYLGFFDEKLKDKWKGRFEAEGFDVFENQIGAYSTLGYFKDPIYSTYLDFDQTRLARLILHEMAHEKIYFRTDSDFSESLAAYLEKAAANLFLYKTIHPPASEINKYKIILKEYRLFEDALDHTRRQLETLYAGKLPDKIKLLQKKGIFDALRKELKSSKYSHLEYARELSESSELNNAFMVQHQRYTPRPRNGFSRLLIEDCRENIPCWFAGLEKLKKCDNATRKKFSTTEITLDDALKECKK